MNSLDKMEDYDRLKQERDELAAQVERLKELAGPILGEVMEIAISNGANSISMPDDYVALAYALSHYPSTALREIEARVLESAAATMPNTLAETKLLEQAAAKRRRIEP